jgi:hypothetical protein
LQPSPADECKIKREKRAFIYINTAITIHRKSNRFTQLVESVNVFPFEPRWPEFFYFSAAKHCRCDDSGYGGNPLLNTLR